MRAWGTGSSLELDGRIDGWMEMVVRERDVGNETRLRR
jgi:hypothetical protein